VEGEDALPYAVSGFIAWHPESQKSGRKVPAQPRVRNIADRQSYGNQKSEKADFGRSKLDAFFK
jgi:hypothetical protein